MTLGTRVEIVSWGRYLPQRVLTNAELAGMFGVTEEWIHSRTGIKERRISMSGDTVWFMAVEAGREALERAGISASEVDLIIVATCTPDTNVPASAARVQAALGAQSAFGFDLNMACTGSVGAMITASAYIRAGMCRTALVIGSECISQWADWTDRNSCIVFGDGAGAVVLRRSDKGNGFLDQEIHTDGHRSEFIQIDPPKVAPVDGGLSWGVAQNPRLHMKGRGLFAFAVTVVPDLLLVLAARHGLRPKDFDLIIPHQANVRILDEIAENVDIPREKIFTTIEHYGNNSAASVPIALYDAAEQGRLHTGDLVAFIGYGAGAMWGAALYRW